MLTAEQSFDATMRPSKILRAVRSYDCCDCESPRPFLDINKLLHGSCTVDVDALIKLQIYFTILVKSFEIELSIIIALRKV